MTLMTVTLMTGFLDRDENDRSPRIEVSGRFIYD